MGQPAITRRRLILLLLLLVPAAWAGLVQMLVRRSPPGAAITTAMGDILAAMEQIPPVADSDPACSLQWQLEDGETWRIRIEITGSEKGDPHLMQKVGVAAEKPRPVAAPRGGIYRLRARRGMEDSWELEIIAEEGGNLEAPFLCGINRRVVVSPVDPGGDGQDLRDRLFRRTGLYLPGSFKEALRPREWCGEMPGHTPGWRTAALVHNLGLKVLKDRMPPRGGLMFLGPTPYMKDDLRLKLLSYRRIPFERGPWEGWVELLVRGDFHFPRGRVHLLEGTTRLRDIISLQKHRREGAEREFRLVIKQTVLDSHRDG